MLIRSLNVAKYGVCRDTDINDIKDDLVVVYGPNEAGKTTCMEFIRGVFYGLSNDGRDKYVRGDSEDVFGGSVSIDSGDGQSCVVSRELTIKDGKSREKLDILIGGQLHSATTMNRDLLKGVDQDVFRNVFTVGLDELQHLNTLNATDAAEFLYEMTTGMDRVSLGEVLRGVTQTRRSIFDRGQAGSEIQLLQTRIEQLALSIHNERPQLEAWSQLRNELRAGKQDIERIGVESDAMRRSVKLFELATTTRDVWIQRREALKQLEDMPGLSEGIAEIAAADSLQQLRAWESERVSLSEEIEELAEKVGAVRVQIDMVPNNADVASNAVRIHAICEHASWLVSLQDQVASLKIVVAEHSSGNDFDISTGLLDRIAGPMPDVDHHILRSVSQAETELKFADERHAEQALLVDHDRVEFKDVDRAWMDLIVANAPQLINEPGQSSHSTTVGRNEMGFESLIADSGSAIRVLRTRLALDDQQQRLQREIESTENSIATISGGLPTGKVLVTSAGLTVAGFVAVAVGFVFYDVFSIGASAATLIGILGMISIVAGVGYRILDLASRKQEEVAVTSRQSLLNRQISQCHADITAIESINDLSGASWDIQLCDLQERHSVLELMVPVLGKLKTADARLQLSRARLADFKRYADEAEQSWANALVQQGLPAGMRPSDVHAIATNLDVIAKRKRRLDDRKAELARREAELADLVNRIEQLLIDLDTQPESLEPAAQIRQLSRLLNEQRESKQQRKLLKKTTRKLKKQRNKIIGRRQDLQTSLNRIFIRAGVSDLAELVQLSRSHCEVLELKSQCDDASGVIRQQLEGKEFDVNDLYAVLDGHDGSELKGEIERLSGLICEASETLARLHEEQGQKKQELQQLLDDPSLAAAKLELTVVRQQLDDAQRRWRVWAVTEYVLHQVRDVYESERQPETLIDGGQWLSKISNGKYIRIWTPLDEDALYVDDDNGQTWGVDMLSRGTRESVFICLRLALVNSYTKRGVRLPLILDDVLVNCDAERAKHGVAMLRDFAEQGTQVFFFTCHSHLTEEFESVNADVRELPLRNDVVAPDIQRFSSASTEGVSDPSVAEASLQELDLSEIAVLNGTDEDNIELSEEELSEEELSEEELSEEELSEEELSEEELSEEELSEEELSEEELSEEELSEEELSEEELSTEQEIKGVERLLGAVAVKMEQASTDLDSSSAFNDRRSANLDIGELVTRAIDESRVAEQFDEIEIIDEDDCETRIGGINEEADEVEDARDEYWDADDIEDEDGLAA
jgi:uncharacterized protein YhaN